MADDQDVVVAIAAHGEANAAGGGGDGGGGNSNAKASVKTKFSKRPTRGMKAAPAYMSFDDVDVEGMVVCTIEDRTRGDAHNWSEPGGCYFSLPQK